MYIVGERYRVIREHGGAPLGAIVTVVPSPAPKEAEKYLQGYDGYYFRPAEGDDPDDYSVEAYPGFYWGFRADDVEGPLPAEEDYVGPEEESATGGVQDTVRTPINVYVTVINCCWLDELLAAESRY